MAELSHEWANNPSYDSKTVEKEYADEAKYYDKNLSEWECRHPVDSANIMRAHVPLESKILEAGCGTGLPGMSLRNAGYTNIWGCDLSQEMLDIAKAKNIHTRLFKVDLQQPLPFDDDQFDAVHCIGVFVHIREAEPVLREFCRITANEGHVVFSQRNDLYYKWDCQTAYDNIEKMGLWKNKYVSEFWPYLPKCPAFSDKIKVAYFVYKVSKRL